MEALSRYCMKMRTRKLKDPEEIKPDSVIEFDSVFDYIGHFGLIQKLIFVFVGIPCMICGSQNIASTFLAADMPHWCVVPRLENYSYTQQREIAIPYNSDYDEDDEYDEQYESCKMFDLPWDNYTDEELLMWNRDEMTAGADTISCGDGWVYRQHDFLSTIVNHWDLVCDDKWIVPLGTTAYMSGIFFGSFIAGYLSDGLGRLRAFTMCNILHCASAIAAAYAPNIIAYTIFRMLVSIAVNGGMVVGVVIAAELIGPRHRTWATILYMLFFAVGFMLLPICSLVVRDHQYLQIILAAPSATAVLLHWLLPESPRWLLTQNRHQEALETIQLMAEVNGTHFPNNVTITLGEDSTEQLEGGTFTDLMKHPFLRKATFVFLLIWFATALAYYGVSINLGELTGNVFVNTLIAGAIEIPADLAAVPLVSHRRIGRRLTAGGSLLLGGTGMIASVPFLVLSNDNLEWLTIVCVMIGKFGITITYTSLFLYTTEVFPTTVRNVALGGCAMISGLGTTIAPYFGNPMQNIWEGMPNLTIGCFVMVAGLLTFLLPETVGCKMPDTIEEAEQLAKKSQRKLKKRRDSSSKELDNPHA